MEVLFFRITKIRVRISIILSVFVLLIVMLVSGWTNYIYSKKIIAQTSDISQQKLRFIAKDIDAKVASVMGTFAIIRDNAELQQLMKSEPYSEEKLYDIKRKVSSILRKYAYSDMTINSIFAFDLDRQIYDPLYLISPYSDIVKNYSEFDDFLSSGKFFSFSRPTNFPYKMDTDEDKAKTTITFFSEYFSNTTFKKIGYILLNVKKDYFFNDVKRYLKTEFDEAYIINSSGSIIYRVSNLDLDVEEIRRHFLNNDNELQIIHRDRYLVYTERLNNYPDWKVVGIMSFERIRADAMTLVRLSYLIIGVSLVLALIIAYIISNKITNPVLQMKQAMDEFQKGRWPQLLKPTTDDELRSLVIGFNEMIEGFQKSIEQISFEQKEKKKVEVQALQLKLDLLQSQINPHFVHNTLNAIQFLALQKGAHDIREMIQSFNVLLRASMSVGKEYMTIGEELECLKSYIKIQSYRYDDEFKIIYDVDDNALNYKIPKLVLQPLVENAIYHGILPKESEGTIRVRIFVEENKIKIEVIDDGVGITKEKFDNLFIVKERSNNSSYNNIGLYNVNERLKLHFGEVSKLHIVSKLGIGTYVKFVIPIVDK